MLYEHENDRIREAIRRTVEGWNRDLQRYAVTPLGAEVHSEDGRSWIRKEPQGWQICFNGVRLEALRTRELARARIRQYKADPGLAVCQEVHQS